VCGKVCGWTRGGGGAFCVRVGGGWGGGVCVVCGKVCGGTRGGGCFLCDSLGGFEGVRMCCVWDILGKN